MKKKDVETVPENRVKREFGTSPVLDPFPNHMHRKRLIVPSLHVSWSTIRFTRPGVLSHL